MNNDMETRSYSIALQHALLDIMVPVTKTVSSCNLVLTYMYPFICMFICALSSGSPLVINASFDIHMYMQC